MSLLMLRPAILAQGTPDADPPLATGILWELDTSRRPAGYTLTDGNQTAINTSGGNDYRRWVPSAKAILASDGWRYWEVVCAPGGPASFDGYIGVVSAAQREEFNAGQNPTTLGSIGWRGNGTLWSSNTATSNQSLNGLPGFGANDILMFTLDPANARLWIGKNGFWRNDPATSTATWTAARSPAFYPQIHGRSPGEGGTLRSLPAQFSYPVPPGVSALGALDPDLRIFDATAFLEIGWDQPLSLANTALWISRGGGVECTHAQATLYIEVELP
jgi:hypothetical protein